MSVQVLLLSNRKNEGIHAVHVVIVVVQVRQGD